MSPLCKIFLLYSVAVLFYFALLIGIAFLTEMMAAIQLFIISSTICLFYAWRVRRTWRNFFAFICVSLICQFLSVYVGISGTLVGTNGVKHILGGWLACSCIVSLLQCYFLALSPGSEQKYFALSIIGTLTVLLFIAFTIILAFSNGTVAPFFRSEYTFTPNSINEKTLKESGYIAYNRCFAPECHRFVFNSNLSLRSSKPLPDGFLLEQVPLSKSSIRVTYHGNGTLENYCENYEIFVRCSVFYEASLGLIWIGKTCPSIPKVLLALPCLPIDATVASFLYWFGVVTICFFGLFFSILLKKKRKRKIKCRGRVC